MRWLRKLNILNWVLDRALHAHYKRLLDSMVAESVDGVAICRPDPRGREGFVRIARKALSLVKSTDARRYHRVCGNLNYIMNSTQTSVGEYDRDLKVCKIDYDNYFTTCDHERNVRNFACALISEATHGFFARKSIPYNRKTRERVERTCHLEEYRFAMKLDPAWAEKHIGSFEVESWKPYWESTWKNRVAAHCERFKKGMDEKD